MDEQRDGEPRSRPLRFGLRSADILFLMDIPLCGMEYLYPVVAQQYSPPECLPYEDGPMLLDRLGQAATLADWPYRVTVGPFDYGVYRHFPRKPVYLTMLSNPIDRAYRVLERDAGTGPASDALTKYLVGPKAEGVSELSLEAMLEIAKIRLDEFAFFGLLERFEDSLELLRHTFSWGAPAKRSVPRLPIESPGWIPQATRRELEEMNPLDTALYEYAWATFAGRHSQMRREKSEESRQRRQDLVRDWLVADGGLTNAGHPFRRALRLFRRKLVPENSRLEEIYLRVRRRLFG